MKKLISKVSLLILLLTLTSFVFVNRVVALTEEELAATQEILIQNAQNNPTVVITIPGPIYTNPYGLPLEAFPPDSQANAVGGCFTTTIIMDNPGGDALGGCFASCYYADDSATMSLPIHPNYCDSVSGESESGGGSCTGGVQSCEKDSNDFDTGQMCRSEITCENAPGAAQQCWGDATCSNTPTEFPGIQVTPENLSFSSTPLTVPPQQSVTITNTGQATLNWEFGSGWVTFFGITVNPSSGTLAPGASIGGVQVTMPALQYWQTFNQWNLPFSDAYYPYVNDSVLADYTIAPAVVPPCNENALPGNNKLVGCAFEDPTSNTYTGQGSSGGAIPGGSNLYFSTLTTPAVPVLDGFQGTAPVDNFTALNVDWESNDPAGVDTGQFSVRMRGNFNLTGGDYIFTLTGNANGGFPPGVDDGYRLFIDGTDSAHQISPENMWRGRSGHTGAQNYTVNGLAPGNHLIVIEYFDYSGGSAIRLSWARQAPPPLPSATASIQANSSDNPPPIPYNTGAILSWTYSNATSCTITPPGIINITTTPASGSGSISTGSLTTGRTYTITCDPGSVNDDVQVNVNPPANYTLTITKSGQGNVVSNPVGISCGGDCIETYDPLTSVTLTATPAQGRMFVRWTGNCSGTTPQTSVTMDSSKTCNAIFVVDPTFKEF